MTITRQREELPVQAMQSAAKLVGTTMVRVNLATDLVAKTQDKIASAGGELTERSVDVASSVRKFTPAATATRVKGSAQGRGGQAHISKIRQPR